MSNGNEKTARRRDPYKNYKFIIKWDTDAGALQTILGVSKISALKRTTEVVTYRSGGDNSRDFKDPGRTSYEGITCERGITHDHEFENWAKKVHPHAGDSSVDPDHRKNLILEVMNDLGEPVLRYNLHECWVSEFTALPDLDANANAVAIESIKIELESWDRDPELPEPGESTQ